MPPNPAQKVPQVGHRDPPGPHSRDVNSCPRERQGGYKQIPPDLPGGYKPPGRLLLQLQRLSSVAGFRLTPKGRWCYVCMYGHHIQQSMDQPGKVANPARGQLNREKIFPLSPCVPENLVSRDGFSRPVPRQPAHLHTQAESGAYLRDSSRVPRRRPMKPPYAIGSVPSLSGHAIAYRWRSLPRVRRHRACKPQGSSERVLPWQITMDQLIFASLSHTHY